MPKTTSERLSVIETKFETVVMPMAFKIDQIHDSMPEFNRKINEHHVMYNALKEAQCPNIKVMPEERKLNSEGFLEERRSKKSLWLQFKELPLPKKVSILIVGLPFVGGYWDWLLSTSQKLLAWLQSVT